MSSDGRDHSSGFMPHSRPDVTARTAEAVGALASLWSTAADAVAPRLSPLQLQTLAAIRAAPLLNLRALAAATGTLPSAASRLCDRLEAAGLLRRMPASTSRREITLVLTPQGSDVLDAVTTHRIRALDAVLHRMPAASRQDLIAGLQALAVVLNAGPLSESDRT
ncbi:MarR family winged helix-turn-helix transcriptional regulator [Streptomyces sp. SGAir0957]